MAYPSTAKSHIKILPSLQNKTFFKDGLTFIPPPEFFLTFSFICLSLNITFPVLSYSEKMSLHQTFIKHHQEFFSETTNKQTEVSPHESIKNKTKWRFILKIINTAIVTMNLIPR